MLCAAAALLMAAPAGAQSVKFIRGDVNGDGILSPADIVSVSRSFHSNRMPPCADAADFDDSGSLDVTDLFNLVSLIYFRGRYPSPPYAELAEDPTPDDLGCWSRRGGGGRDGLAALAARVDGDVDDGQIIDFIEFYARRTEGYPGERGIRVPILISNSAEIDGFTVCVTADPSKVWFETIEPVGRFPNQTKPEFQPVYSEQIVKGYLGLSVFMDYQDPFEGNRLPKSSGLAVAYLVFGLSPDVQPGEKTWIKFADIPTLEDLRPTPINEMSIDGRSVRPFLEQRGLEVTVYPKSQLFLRGDPNGDGALNITDMILILRYLFIGESLDCHDPADADDSGVIDISDVIALADHLYGKGRRLPAPFPNPGRDSSPDDLGDCR